MKSGAQRAPAEEPGELVGGVREQPRPRGEPAALRRGHEAVGVAVGDVERGAPGRTYATGLARRADSTASGSGAPILGHPAVQNVACIPCRRRPRQGMCACIVPRAEAPTLAELLAFPRRHEIAAVKLPERLEVLDAFPLSPIGKVSKRDLVARFS